MLKVTVQNVTRLSEDSLYSSLQDLNESDPIYTLIEAELDRRADTVIAQNKRKLERDLQSLAITKAIQDEVQAIFDGFKGKKTLMLIEHLGQEFIEDYTVCEQSYTVYSKVSHAFFSSPGSWTLPSIEKARAKKAKLIYYRIYDKFMRDPCQENLELLRKIGA